MGFKITLNYDSTSEIGAPCLALMRGFRHNNKCMSTPVCSIFSNLVPLVSLVSYMPTLKKRGENVTEGGDPLSFATEIIIEIKQFNFGRMASHPFIEGNRRYMVFPLRDTFTIENVLLFV